MKFSKEHQLIPGLVRSGLTKKEAAIYAALLELGGAFPSKIAEVTGINRSTVYKVLLDLSVKGLVVEMKKRNKMYYQVESPKALEKYAKSRIRLAEEDYQRAQKILPELQGLFASSPHKPRLWFFEGKEGVLRVYDDHLEQPQSYEMLGFSHTDKLQSFLPQGYIKQYVKKKEQQGITTRGILPDTQAHLRYNETVYAHVRKRIHPRLRFTPADDFFFPGELTIYGENRVSIINFHHEKPIGVIIEDDVIHGMMKTIFELAWKGAA